MRKRLLCIALAVVMVATSVDITAYAKNINLASDVAINDILSEQEGELPQETPQENDIVQTPEMEEPVIGEPTETPQEDAESSPQPVPLETPSANPEEEEITTPSPAGEESAEPKESASEMPTAQTDPPVL